jgi:hypothetical protein
MKSAEKLAASIRRSLREDRPQVGVHGSWTDDQSGGEVVVAESLGQQADHLGLALGEAGGQRAAFSRLSPELAGPAAAERAVIDRFGTRSGRLGRLCSDDQQQVRIE